MNATIQEHIYSNLPIPRSGSATWVRTIATQSCIEVQIVKKSNYLGGQPNWAEAPIDFVMSLDEIQKILGDDICSPNWKFGAVYKDSFNLCAWQGNQLWVIKSL